MDKVTIRDFLRSPKAVLPPPEAGLEITRRDGSSFFIYPKKMDVRQMSDNIMPLSDKKEVMSDNLNGGENPEKKLVEALAAEVFIRGWCQLHFEKGVEYPLRNISWEDENGVAIVDKKWACPKCVEKYENMGKGKVYYEKILPKWE